MTERDLSCSYNNSSPRYFKLFSIAFRAAPMRYLSVRKLEIYSFRSAELLSGTVARTLPLCYGRMSRGVRSLRTEEELSPVYVAVVAVGWDSLVIVPPRPEVTLFPLLVRLRLPVSKQSLL